MDLNRRRLLLLPLVASMLPVLAAHAATTQVNFTQAAFDAAQKEDKPILVYIEASWCPTCAKQRPIIQSLEKDPAFANLTIFSVDFDTQKDVVKAFGVRMQSTLLAFHGKDERARSTGETNPDKIRDILAKTQA
jgi:thioredoxin 1